ncbi:MAG: LCP family protein [Clostridia bacterium]|nr:LCP family protein [Clostridia bacterium]
MGRSRERKRKRTGLKILLVIILLIAVAAGVFIYKVNQNGGSMKGVIATVLGHDSEKLKDLEPLYFVVLGESVAGDSRLTDTIIVCKYDPKTQQAAMMSVPRDTYTGSGSAADATASYKINAAYNMGKNPENTVKILKRITGLDLQYYVWVNTNVLKEIVDEIGGVWFDVPKDMHYTDVTQNLYIDLKAGYQLLDGDHAEQLVRYRHDNSTRSNYGPTYSSDYGVEDYGRMRTQREFIKAAIEQTIKPENFLKIGKFLEIAYRNIKTNIPMDVLKDYIPYAVDFNTENLRMDLLPGSDTNQTKDESWVYFVNTSKTKQVVDRLFVHPELYDNEGNKIEATNTTTNNTTNSAN